MALDNALRTRVLRTLTLANSKSPNETGLLVGVIAGASYGAYGVADPRLESDRHGPLGVHSWKDSARTIAGESFPTNGAFSVADPRVMHREKGDHYLTGGDYGVVPWSGSSGAVSGSACHDNGGWSLADPRRPGATDQLVAVIRALDDTWHRPFTTLEPAALQSLVDPEEFLELDGLSDSAWRERIGNAVPSDAAPPSPASWATHCCWQRQDRHSCSATRRYGFSRLPSDCRLCGRRRDHRDFQEAETP